MGTIQDKLDLTLNNKNNIKNAIRSKGIEVTDEEPFSNYAEKIINYNGIDTSDATATSNEIAKGTFAYVNGEKVEGALVIVKSGNSLPTSNISYGKVSNRLDFYNDSNVDLIIRKGGGFNALGTDIAKKIELTPEKIAKGNTILGVEGTFKSTDTSDANATASDILKGKSAYVNDEKIDGTIEVKESMTTTANGDVVYVESGGRIEANFSIMSGKEGYYPKDANILVKINEAKIAEAIGLDETMLQRDTTILGVEGVDEPWIIQATSLFNLKKTLAYAKDGDIGVVYTYDEINNTISEYEDFYVVKNGAWELISKSSNNLTATASDIKVGKTACVGNEIVTGTYEEPTGTLEITETAGLFYNSARLNIMDELISMCKNITDTKQMFYNASKLVEPPFFDTSEVTNATEMFYYCYEMTNMPLYDFSKVKYASSMFKMCKKMITYPLFDFSSVTSADNMFMNNSALVSIPQFNTSKLEDAYGMFYGDSVLETVPELDFSNVIKINDMFSSAKKLTNLGGFKNLGKKYTQKTQNYSNYTLKLSSSTVITYESLLNVLNNLYDLNLSYKVAEGGTLYRQKVEIGSTNLAKLQATEEGLTALEAANAKGWNIV